MEQRSLIGQTIGKYKVVESLGRGGMAEVYRAYQENLDRYVAVKLMHSFLADEENFLTRFQREAKAMASLNHRNIVSVYDFDVQNGIYYIVMEFVSGGTLKEMIENMAKSGDHLALDKAVRITLEIADALAYAHGKGMVHRDIKPGNIMIGSDGSAVLTDFGIAKILSGPSFTATGAMIGTPAYMSPEQGLGRPGDERSDIYALGVLFYQMVTGQLPYDADTPLAVILKHVNDPIPAPREKIPDIPEPIEKVILKAMAKDPADRYQTASSMARELQEASGASNLELTGGFVFEFISETPTPPPGPVSKAPVDATVLSSQPSLAPKVDATRIASSDAIGHTEIATPVIPPKPVVEETKKKRGSGWIFALAGLVLIAVIAVGAIVFLTTQDGEPTPTPPVTSAAEVADVEATALAATASAEGDDDDDGLSNSQELEIGTDPDNNDTDGDGLTDGQEVNQWATDPKNRDTDGDTLSDGDEVNEYGTAPKNEDTDNDGVPDGVEIRGGTDPLLRTTATVPPTDTPEPTAPPSPTPNLTATFIAGCTKDVELVDSFTYRQTSPPAAQTGSTFPMSWVLRNTGTCPVPAGTEWTFVGGEDFDQAGPASLAEELPSGGEVTLQVDMRAPTRSGNYETTWQLVEGSGDAYGLAIDEDIFIFPAATPTPANTPTPEATPTPVVTGPFGYNWNVVNCHSSGTSWQCTIVVEPFGGSGNYAFTTDEVPAPDMEGVGPFLWDVVRPCTNLWVQTISVSDTGTGQTIREARSVDPANFPGICS